MNDITQLSTLYSNAIARAEKAEEALRKMEPLVEAMKGIDHFKDALNWRQDHLSKALLQWIYAGSSALEALSEPPPPPVRETP